MRTSDDSTTVPIQEYVHLWVLLLVTIDQMHNLTQ